MRNLRRFYIFIILLITTFSNINCTHQKCSNLKKGFWKAELFTKDGISIPFIFEVICEDGKQVLLIQNAEERLKVDELIIAGDSLKINMPFFDSEFMVHVTGDSLVGRWTRIYPDHTVSMPVKAYYGIENRFESDTIANKNIAGTWDAIFTNEEFTDTSIAIGEFKIVKNKIYGTFLSTTGDYRYLEGTTNGSELSLSTFDGSHAYLFKAELSADNNSIINASLYSGWSGKQLWTAKRNDLAKLPNADSLTFLKDGIDKLEFQFKNIDGKLISLTDSRYDNKVVVIQIMGTWCPNCMDETSYLVPFYNNIKAEGLEVIGLCYERSEDFEVAANNVTKMKNRLQIPYELLIPGSNKKGFVNESLPMLKNFLAFPTMIIIDKQRKVRKIHTGYSGPATGKHYIEFKAEFESFIKKLLSEK
jgi:peroxiredoxin